MKRFLALLASLALVLSVSTTSASADSDSTTRVYLAGTGIVCGLGVPDACPSIAMADNGHTIELTAEGTFSLHPKTVTGGGTFVHKDEEGDVVASGTWDATELLSFHSYGTIDFFGTTIEGGQLRLRAHLFATLAGGGTAEADAILEIDCAVSAPPPGSSTDSVRVNVQGLINFNKPVSGLTVYVPVMD